MSSREVALDARAESLTLRPKTVRGREVRRGAVLWLFEEEKVTPVNSCQVVLITALGLVRASFSCATMGPTRPTTSTFNLPSPWVHGRSEWQMASYSLNEHAAARARRLIDAHQYVLDSSWGDVQPSAEDENAFLDSHSWDDYAEWHLALTDGANDQTKARYAFVYGDFRRVHRMGLIACQYRAAEWRHKDVELAAHELLQRLDNTRS
jgi:hypothetical protein